MRGTIDPGDIAIEIEVGRVNIYAIIRDKVGEKMHNRLLLVRIESVGHSVWGKMNKGVERILSEGNWGVRRETGSQERY